MNNNQPIITRFAPSPTGRLHAGNYRTALFAYLYARKNGGKFLLRIEDTDKERSKIEYEEDILDALKWLGLENDGEIVHQAARASIHRAYLEKLVASGHAYVSDEAKRNEDGVLKEGQRAEVIRFKNPGTKVTFTDLIRGDIETDTTDLGDFIIAKNFDEPIFHLAVVVDDFEMGVTHVVRGEDHISNTPRQILIQRAIGAPTPIYANLPIVLSTDRAKLAKRRGAVPITEYKAKGYLPEAVLNYMALVGWNPGTNKEILTKQELIEAFDLAQVQKGGAIFDEVKLLWVNKEHLKLLSDETFTEKVQLYIPDTLKIQPTFNERFPRMLPVLRDRLSYFGELADPAGELVNELNVFFTEPTYDKNLLLCAEKMRKGKVVDLNNIATHLTKVTELLSALDDTKETWTSQSIKNVIWPYAEQEGRGIILWATRVALSGKERSPDPFTIAYVIGKADTISRLKVAAGLAGGN